jgi:F-type H+-transporting ATPase subunit a
MFCITGKLSFPKGKTLSPPIELLGIYSRIGGGEYHLKYHKFKFYVKTNSQRVKSMIYLPIISHKWIFPLAGVLVGSTTAGLISWDILPLFLLLIVIRLVGSRRGDSTTSWWGEQLLGGVKVIHTLLFGEDSSGERNFNFISTLKKLFLLIGLLNISGLHIFLRQGYMGKISSSLVLMAVIFWLRSYLPFAFKQKEKFRLFLIGRMKFPSLSFLLSNIEILTHFFRPITLTARLWVNIWVGHLLMRVLSTLCLVTLQEGGWLRLGHIARAGMMVGFFLFEFGIMSLQTFVFTYLVGVYWVENLSHANLSFTLTV